MAVIRPFRAIRPCAEKAEKIAALPYDVMDEEEAREEVRKNPDSFLKIDRPETQFPEGTDPYSDVVYQKAHDLLWQMVDSGDLIREEKPCYYIYELTLNGRHQTGIAACASLDDYESGVIKKHENTRSEKEEDRFRHIDVCGAQTGPIFLAYRADSMIRTVVEKTKQNDPLYDFTTSDRVRHTIWVISNEDYIQAVATAFSRIGSIYIADGHHRCASAVRVGQKRRREHPNYDGTEEFNYFLSVLFPDEELFIIDYNRVVKDLNGLSEEEFLKVLGEIFDVEPLQSENHHPVEKGVFHTYIGGKWYRCRIRDCDRSNDPVNGLDVALLQNLLLEPVLGIEDPKTDPRIDFVGGNRGTEELERRCSRDCKAAFAMYPTSIHELFRAADAGRLMPPKSTWFEPKLRSGLFIHEI